MSFIKRKTIFFFKNCFTRYTLLPIVLLLFIALGRYTVLRQTKVLIETSITAYQQTELEIVRGAARSAELYILHEIEVHGRTNITKFEQEVFEKFIAPIYLLENGDAWIYAPDYVIFDLSANFPDEYRGKSMAKIFELQEINGASHFDEMTVDIREAREGVGWYVWLPEKGKEIAAWTPIRVGEYVWTIGLSIPLSEILESTGAAEQIRAVNRAMGIGTFVLLGALLLWGIGAVKCCQADKKLSESEERQRTLLDAVSSAGILLFVVDNKYRVRYMNKPMIEAFEDAVGEICYTAIDGGESPCAYCQLAKVLQDKEKIHYQPTLSDGRTFDVIALPYTDIDGTPCKLEIIQDITERMRMEDESRKLHQAVEQSANSVVITDLNGVIEYVNPKFVKITGYSMEEALGENPRILQSGEHSEEFYEVLWQTITAGNEWHGEFCNKRKDGSICWEQASISPLFDEAGQMTNFVAVKEDITSQIYIERALQKSYRELEDKVKERTAELRESEERYRLLAENTSDFVWITDIETLNLTYASPSVGEILGFSSDEIIARPLAERLPPDSVKKVWQILEEELARNIEGEEPERTRVIEAKMYHKDGRTIWIETTARFLYDEGEKLIGLMGAARDITERMRVEDALKLSESRANALLEAVPDFILRLNRQGDLLDYRAAQSDLYAQAVDTIIGKKNRDLMSPEFADFTKEKISQTLNSGEMQTFEYQLSIPERGPVDYEARMVKSGADEVMVIVRDVTERKEMERNLRRQAITDPLTKIFNRRHFFEMAQQELERSQRYNRRLSIIMFDIDHFKKVNDTYGHGAGDKALCLLTTECQNKLRENDIFARYGGEEFIILLPETDLEQARQLAERMHKGCAETSLDVGVACAQPGATVNLTASFGVASLGNENIPLDELLFRADKALYEAKEAGRNCVIIWPPEKKEEK